IEMPRHKGKAIRKTKKPESKSLRQFSFNPANPVFGDMDDEISRI
ncbi:MAG: hypothetical protein RIS10_1244, partial [Pseudomonadota bacterium]